MATSGDGEWPSPLKCVGRLPYGRDVKDEAARMSEC